MDSKVCGALAPISEGAFRLTTRGRRSGEPLSVIIGYYEDGPNLVAIAMNGWGANEPAWWLNLQAPRGDRGIGRWDPALLRSAVLCVPTYRGTGKA